jgi:hypothetical protein
MGSTEQPKQKTKPAQGEPVEIPIPTREEVFRDLEKVAPPPKRRPKRD